MTQDITVETRKIAVSGQPMQVSIITHHKLVGGDVADSREKIAAAYQTIAAQFLQSPDADQQKSVCVITDLTPLAGQLNQQVVDAWFANASADDLQTQHYLFQLFQRPAFQLQVIKNVNLDELNRRSRELNPSANATTFVPTLDEALEMSASYLKLAHRL